MYPIAKKENVGAPKTHPGEKTGKNQVETFQCFTFFT